MPSLSSRSINLSNTHVRVTPEPVGIGQQPLPTPLPIGVLRSPLMLTSMPAIAATSEAAMRQFYGGRGLPMRRVSQL